MFVYQFRPSYLFNQYIIPRYHDSGEASRECTVPGKWDPPNFDSCVDEVYENILDEVIMS